MRCMPRISGFRAFVTALALAATAVLVHPAGISAQSGELTDDDFFSTDDLQEIRLTVNSRDWQQLKEQYLSNTYYPSDMQWRGLVVRGVGIRSRGTGSRNPFKPGIKIDINYYLPRQEFLGLKAIVLDNLAQDPSMLRERLIMRLFQRMGIPAPRVTHARLFVNNQFAGVYGITEAIDQQFLARVFGADSQGGVESDGYLFEYRWIGDEEPFLFSYLGPDLSPYAMRFIPRTHERADPETLYRPIEQMFKTIDESSGSELEQAVSEYLDLPMLMRQVAVESFVADWDGILGAWGPNNFYLYRFEGTRFSRLIPWDKDFAFFSPFHSVMTRADENHLFRAAMETPGLYDLYMQSLLETADSAETPQFVEGEGISPGWMEREIRHAFDQIREAALADANKPYANDEFLATIDGLLEFARIRSHVVRCEVYRYIDPGRVGPECEF